MEEKASLTSGVRGQDGLLERLPGLLHRLFLGFPVSLWNSLKKKKTFFVCKLARWATKISVLKFTPGYKNFVRKKRNFSKAFVFMVVARSCSFFFLNKIKIKINMRGRGLHEVDMKMDEERRKSGAERKLAQDASCPELPSSSQICASDCVFEWTCACVCECVRAHACVCLCVCARLL